MKKKRKAKRQAKHPLEKRYPEQCAEYRKIMGEDLYPLFLDKGLDYGVNNVKALGLLGLALRMFEKNIRLLNLLGWDPWKGEPIPATKPKFESVESELIDLANIAIIAMIRRRGKWAK